MPPARVSCWYMHDDHTFTQLHGGLLDVLRRARELARESPYGMLCPATVLDENEHDLYRVGKPAHDRGNGIDEGELTAWRDAVLNEPSTAHLFIGRK